MNALLHPGRVRLAFALVAVAVAVGACAAQASEPPPAAPVASPPNAMTDTPSDAAVPEPAVREGLVVGNPEAEGIDGDALAELVSKAEAQRSRRWSS